MAESLILIPTLMADARAYLSLINAQLPRRAVHIVLPQGPGGVSDWAARALREAPPRFCLVGHGLGALVAAEMALGAPDRVSRMVLIGGAAQPDIPARIADQEKLLVQAGAGSLGAAVLSLTGISEMPTGADRAALEDLVLAMSFDLGVKVFTQQLRALQRRTDRQARLRKIPCPTLLLAAERDPVFAPRQLELMSHMLPNASLRQVSGAGFWMPVEMPQRMAELISDFLPEPLMLG